MKQCLAAILVLAFALPAGAQQLSFDEAVARLRLPDSAARLQALSLLQESAYPEAGAPIAALLTDPDERVQRAALYAELGIFTGARIETRRRVALVVEVRDTAPAARAFDDRWGSLPLAPVPDAVISALVGLTQHRDPAFRLEALYTLGVLAQVDGSQPTPAQAQVAQVLAERLGDPAPEMRSIVARVAGRIFERCAAPCEAQGVQRLGDALVHSLNDPNAAVRASALHAIGSLKWDRAVQALGQSYEYYRGKTEAAAYLATLARIAHPSSVGLLKEALAQRDGTLRLIGGEGLARIGGAEAVSVSTALDSDNLAGVRVAAAFALAKSGQGAGIDRLVQAIDPSATRAQAQEYLVEVGAGAAPAVAAALSTGGAERRVALLQVLSVVGGPSELPSVEALQRDANAAVAAASERTAQRIKARAR